MPSRSTLSEWMLELLADSVDDYGMQGVCTTGRPHQYDGVECRVCGEEPYAPDSDRPAGWCSPEPYPGHVCFDDCRHRRSMHR